MPKRQVVDAAQILVRYTKVSISPKLEVAILHR